MKEKTNVFIVGCSGRMGTILHDLIQNSDDLVTTHGFDKTVSSYTGFTVCCSPLTSLPDGIDVIVDFSNPTATLEVLPIAANMGIPMVIGTTKFTQAEEQIIEGYSKYIPIFRSANMSYGVNVMIKLSKFAAELLGGYEICISEFHHSKKVDAPSGTADMLFKAINEVHSNKLVKSYGSPDAKKSNEVWMSAQRGGAFSGKHTVTFAGQNDYISIEHFAFNPTMFAEGALNAVRYIVEQKNNPGYYTMDDLLKIGK